MSRQRPDSRRGDRPGPLAGQHVMVIGPAASLAPTICRDASRRGARVALATTVAPPEGVHSEYTIVLGDCDSEAASDRIHDAMLERLSGLDVVIVVLEAPPLEDLHALTLERWREFVAAPLRRTFWIAQRALDEFVGSGRGGRLILVVERPDGEPGAASKGVVVEALASLARSVAREYGRQAVSCHVVVQTGSAGNAAGGESRHPGIECVLFLASPAASFVTGEVFTVGDTVTLPSGSRTA